LEKIFSCHKDSIMDAWLEYNLNYLINRVL